MHFLRLRQRFAAWLALLALLAGALAPTLAQAALAGQDRAGWVEVCSATGMVWVRADDTARPSPADGLAAELVDALADALADAPANAAGDASADAAGAPLAAAPAAGQVPGHDAGSHCPWCSLHGGAAGLPPSAWQADLPAPAGALPLAFLHTPALQGVWAAAHARAPPPAA